MPSLTLPPHADMVRAYQGSDTEYDGLFITAVKTTGIFCKPSCPARKPFVKNVEFFPSCETALCAGYRPCKRCRPLETSVRPDWLAPLIDQVEREPARRWKDEDLRRLSLQPARVSRWFKSAHGMTFHAYVRARRLGEAMRLIQNGSTVTSAAFGIGYESLGAFNEAFQQFAGTSASHSADAVSVYVSRITTPMGDMVVASTESHLVLLEFCNRRMLSTQLSRVSRAMRCVFVPGEPEVTLRLRSQLAEYFAGSRLEFDVPLDDFGTPFQRLVWNELRKIPAGQTVSYSDIARAIGRPTAVRAVAHANGDNRVSILIPCHRVIGADGSLTGYGGGIWRKERLLALERGEAIAEASPELLASEI